MSHHRRWPLIVVGFMTAMYLAYFSWFTLRAYDVFVYQAYDLGIYDQAVWNTIHGQPFRSTLEEPYDILLGDHFEPILLPIALVYFLWDSPKALLLIQTAVLALGALPVYWLARDGLESALARSQSREKQTLASDQPLALLLIEVSAVGFAGIYLLYPPVHSANVFEFHPSALAISLLLYTIYFLRRRRFALYFLFLILTMSTKEVVPLTTFVLGLYAFFMERKRTIGLWTMLASALWFGLVVFVIIPHFSPEGQSQYFGEYYGWLGGNASEVLARLVTHPELIWQRLARHDSLLYIRGLLRPVAYVAVLGLPMLLVATPALFLNILSDFPFQHNPLNFFQYAAAIAPFVIVAAIDGTAFLARQVGSLLERLRLMEGQVRDVRPLVAIAVAGASLVVSLAAQRYHGYVPFSSDFYLAPRDEKVAAAEALVQRVPAQGIVSSDLIFGPHLSHRESIYLYPSLHDAEYVVADASYRDAPFPPRDRFEAIQAMLTGGQYGVAEGRNGYLLLERGLDQQSVPDPFYDFARATEPSPQVETNIVFGDELRLLGFDLAWERPVRPHAHLVLYWQAMRPIDRDLRLFFVLTDPSGELVPGTEMEFDAPVWYPPSRWLETEVVRTETLHWSAEESKTFGIAIGVVDGPGFWEVDKRLPPAVQSAPWPMPQVHDGSLVWLATLKTDGRIVWMEEPGNP
jgi:uncharacterized membrane protein